MTDRIAIILGLIILVVLAADHFYFHYGILLFLGRKLTQFIEFLEFWR